MDELIRMPQAICHIEVLIYGYKANPILQPAGTNPHPIAAYDCQAKLVSCVTRHLQCFICADDVAAGSQGLSAMVLHYEQYRLGVTHLVCAL